MKTLTLWLVLFLSIGVVGYAIFSYTILSPGTTVAPAMKATYEEQRVRILVHVFASAIALATGPFQFFPAIRSRRLLHRRLGYIYFTAVAVGGAAGFAMSFVAYGGLVSKLGFGILALLWLYAAARSLLAIINKDYAAHEIWAIRCFALTFAAVTLRIYLGLFFAAGFSFDTFYPALGWLCWVPNLLVVEWLILPKYMTAGKTPRNA
jgi:hypothetical protein